MPHVAVHDGAERTVGADGDDRQGRVAAVQVEPLFRVGAHRALSAARAVPAFAGLVGPHDWMTRADEVSGRMAAG